MKLGSPARLITWCRFGLAAMLLLLALPVATQPARNVGIVPDAERSRIGFDPAESAGLFIGIRTFDDPQLAEVPYAVDDAIDLAHLFVFDLALVPAKKVVLALEGEAQKVASRGRLQELQKAGATVASATRSEFYRLLGRQARVSGPRGLFVVSVASHGFSRDGLDSLVTRDAVRDDIADTGFRVNKLLVKVAAAKAPRRLVLLDACRERLTRQRGSGSESAFGRSFVDAIEQAKGQVVLAAATENGFAYDDDERMNGVFTAAILDGLRGEAPADERGFITVETLATFAHQQVAEWVRLHRPGDAERSRGITKTIEVSAAGLPLAIDQTFETRARQFEARKAAALDRLKSEIGPVISGRMYDDVASLLASADAASAEPWLSRIEALDGRRQLQEGFAFFYSQQFRPIAPPPSSTRERRAGDLWTESATGMRFRYIPAGTFQMGSPENEDGRDSNETRHEVTLTQAYWMGETEVTQAQWRALMGNNPSHFKACGDDCPVETVNWFEAVAFANAVSEKAGRSPCYRVSGGNGKAPGNGLEYEAVERIEGCTGFRLPTEAEWEHAARAGTTTALYTGKLAIRGGRNGPELDPIAWYGGNSGVSYTGGWDCSSWPDKQFPDSTACGTHPVGRKRANPWGLHDTLGNVLEWTWDWQGAYPTEPQIDPLGPGHGSYRVLRGGSWVSDARGVRAAYRDWDHPGGRFSHYGFRLSSGPGPEGGAR